jgi:hypothetical protein
MTTLRIPPKANRGSGVKPYVAADGSGCSESPVGLVHVSADWVLTCSTRKPTVSGDGKKRRMSDGFSAQSPGSNHP